MTPFFTRKSIVTAILLVAFGSIGRLLLQDLPNIETITVVTLLATALLGMRWGMVVGVVTVAITDMAIGNTVILLYTWSAWLLVGLFGLLARYRGQAMGKALARLTGAGLLSTLGFYAWTNFGVWHVGELYQHTWTGLVNCYIAGLPFLRNQLISTAVFVPVVGFVAFKAWNLYAVRSEAKNLATAELAAR